MVPVSFASPITSSISSLSGWVDKTRLYLKEAFYYLSEFFKFLATAPFLSLYWSKKYFLEELTFSNAVFPNFFTYKLFIYLGVDPNQQDNEGKTPLSLAIARKDLQRTFLLLKVKANPDRPPHSYHNTYLLQATRISHLEIIKALFTAKANPNLKNHFNTPLTLASSKNQVEIVKILLAIPHSAPL